MGYVTGGCSLINHEQVVHFVEFDCTHWPGCVFDDFCLT